MRTIVPNAFANYAVDHANWNAAAVAGQAAGPAPQLPNEDALFQMMKNNEIIKQMDYVNIHRAELTCFIQSIEAAAQELAIPAAAVADDDEHMDN